MADCDVKEKYEELARAVTRLDQIHNLGDAIYTVKERESLGWEGPLVTEYSNLVQTIAKHKVPIIPPQKKGLV